MRASVLPFAIPFALSIFVSAQPAAAAVHIAIDKSAQTMTVSRDGETIYRWPVSTGRSGYDTPSGSYRAFRMEKDHFSREWDDAPMPNSIFFTKAGHAIHGYLDTKNIGRPASHGCVRLRPDNAAALFALVEREGVLNTTVAIGGAIPAGAPVVARRGQPDFSARDGFGSQPPAPDEDEYVPRDQNYPRRYGAQDWQQPYSGGPLYAQPGVARSDPRGHYDQPRYPSSDGGADPTYESDDDDAPPVYLPRRRYRSPFFPFGD